MHGDVAVAQMLEREHLSTVGRASASEDVSIPTGRSVGRCSADAMLGDRTSRERFRGKGTNQFSENK